MENKFKYLFKNIGVLMIANFSSKILVFLLVPLYTSVLSTTEYGSYDLAVSTATLLFPILTLNIVDAVMRFSMDCAVNKKTIATIGMKFISISAILFGICMWLLKRINLLPGISGLEIYIFLYYASYAVNQLLIQFSKGLERVKDMGIAGVVGTFVTIITNILFLLVLKWGLIGFFFSSILAQMISAIYLAIRIKVWEYIDVTEIDKKTQHEMLMYSVPLIATAVGWWINSAADKYVVAFMLGVASNGLLSVSYKIPQIINTLQGIFTQAWQISAVKEYGEEDTSKFYGNTFSSINLLMCAACSFLIILSKPLAHILYAKEFYVAWQYVPFLLLSSVLNCASGLLGPILAAKKDSKAMMWSAIIGAATNIVMNIILVYLMGIQGATIATVICSYIIYAVRKRAVGKDIWIKDYFIIIVTWMLLFVQAFVESHLSIVPIEIAIMAILIVINVKELKRIFFKIKHVFIH